MLDLYFCSENITEFVCGCRLVIEEMQILSNMLTCGCGKKGQGIWKCVCASGCFVCGAHLWFLPKVYVMGVHIQYIDKLTLYPHISDYSLGGLQKLSWKLQICALKSL